MTPTNMRIEKGHSLLKGAELDTLVNEMKLALPHLKRMSYGKQVMAIEKLLYGTSNPTSVNIPIHSSTINGPSPINSVDHQTAPPQLHLSQQGFQQGPSAHPVLNTFSPR